MYASQSDVHRRQVDATAAGRVVTEVVKADEQGYEVLARVVFRGQTVSQGTGRGATLQEAELQVTSKGGVFR